MPVSGRWNTTDKRLNTIEIYKAVSLYPHPQSGSDRFQEVIQLEDCD